MCKRIVWISNLEEGMNFQEQSPWFEELSEHIRDPTSTMLTPV